MTIKVGDRIPEATLKTMGAKGPEGIDTATLFSGKKVVLFAVPGAFTPTCSAAHLPCGLFRPAPSLPPPSLPPPLRTLPSRAPPPSSPPPTPSFLSSANSSHTYEQLVSPASPDNKTQKSTNASRARP